MAIVVLHTGQSGVERGADRAARAVEIAVRGVCTFEQRDELGMLPAEILADLTPAARRGARTALRETLDRANVLVIAVPDAARANENAGIEALRRAARAAGVPHWVVDPISDYGELGTRLRRMELLSDPLHVMITGPRATRWKDGERIGWRTIAQLSLAPAAAPKKHRILVVDDHVDTAETTAQLLRELGHESISAITGAGGLEAAAQFEPDIALLDLGLPDVSGYEVARQLRTTNKNLFLAAITGSDRDPRETLAAGFDRHVVKPVGVAIIRGLLGHAALELAV